MKLTTAFYQGADVVEIARALLGKQLVTQLGGARTAGIIVETEAYSGRNDRACHANEGRRTARTEVMYAAGGKAYVYLIYGMHYMMNVVTNQQDLADAVLIRALEPVAGLDLMQTRRKLAKPGHGLTAGPGKLCKAMGIDMALYGADLQADSIWIEQGKEVAPQEVMAGPRINVDYAGDHALRPWRFWLKDNKWVSK